MVLPSLSVTMRSFVSDGEGRCQQVRDEDGVGGYLFLKW